MNDDEDAIRVLETWHSLRTYRQPLLGALDAAEESGYYRGAFSSCIKESLNSKCGQIPDEAR